MVGGGGHEGDPVLTRLVNQDRKPWYKKRNLRMMYLIMLPATIGIEMTSGFDSQLINAAQIVPAWQKFFHHPQSAKKGILAAIYSLGAICGIPFVPLINDRYGRRVTVFFGSCIMILGSLIQGFANGLAMYLVARWLLGFGILFCIVAGSSLMGELAHPKERPIVTSLFNALYFIGSLIAAAICFRTNSINSDWAWRIPSLLQMVPSLFQVCFIFLLPESPRFLVSKDRHEEAFAVLVKYHAEGDVNSEFAAAEMSQIETTIKIEMENSKRSWGEMVSTPGMRRRVFVAAMQGLFTQWSGNTLISYYLSDILKQLGFKNSVFQQKVNVGNNAWSLVNAVIISVLVRSFARRKMFMACVISCLFVYIGWTISMERFTHYNNLVKKHPGSPDVKNWTSHAGIAGRLGIFFIFAFSPCYNVGYNALTYTYLVEIFPFAQRTRGIAIFQFFGRGAGFFTTFVNPIGMDAVGWKYLISYCCWLAFEFVIIYFFFPETAGRTLEELAFLFEAKELQDKATIAVEKQLHHENGVHNQDVIIDEDGKETHTADKKEYV